MSSEDKRKLGISFYNPEIKDYQSNSNIIEFKEKKDKKIAKEVENDELDFEDNIPFEKRKSLPNKLRKQFNKIKINNLKRIENVDNYLDDKFIRNKSLISEQIGILNKEISNTYFKIRKRNYNR
jgi:hypothetical protein